MAGYSAFSAATESRCIRRVRLVAIALGLLILAIAIFSERFAYGSPSRDRPIVFVLALFAICFGLHVLGLCFALRCRNGQRIWRTIWWSAVAFRVTFVFSQPILEADYYRYLWDGAVLASGVNPYRYAPRAIRLETQAPRESELGHLATMANENLALSTVLRRVHYADLTTCYPPVSEAVFAFVHLFTPKALSVFGRVVVLKSTLVAFDLATLSIIACLLRLVRRHVGWSIVYAWSPLVLKEIANSGHLDAIAVFFSVAAVTCVVQATTNAVQLRQWAWIIVSALLLGAAVGAKLYPLVLIPVLTACLRSRMTWRAASIFSLTTVTAGAVCVLPMATVPSDVTTHYVKEPAEPVLPGEEFVLRAAPPRPSSSGLKAFLGRWQMNDFLFSLVAENLKPHSNAWFAITPEHARVAYDHALDKSYGTTGQEFAFLGARAVTLLAFVVIVSVLALRAYYAQELPRQLEFIFLTLAWFWLLQPTQNPWYWVWVVPFLPFATGRAWFAVSGIVTMYYLRFWLAGHWPIHPVPGFRYAGKDFFDYVVTWFEYLPWFAWLGAAWALRTYGSSKSKVSTRACVGYFTDTRDAAGDHLKYGVDEMRQR